MKGVLLFCLSLASLLGVVNEVSADGVVALQWQVPTQREDGTAMAASEVGGYEIRYGIAGSADLAVVIIPDGAATTYQVESLGAGDWLFSIAAFDTDGLYSQYVPVTVAVNGVAPGQPGGVTGHRVGVDVVAACLEDPKCTVAVFGKW